MKPQELAAVRELPVNELKVQLRDLEEKLARTKFAHAVSPVKNPLQIRSMRRHKARLITWIRQKEQAGTKSAKKA